MKNLFLNLKSVFFFFLYVIVDDVANSLEGFFFFKLQVGDCQMGQDSFGLKKIFFFLFGRIFSQTRLVI